VSCHGFLNSMNKTIDAVKMVRAIRDKQYKELLGKSEEEVKEYYRVNSEWAFNKSAKKSKTNKAKNSQ
jgi:hypothetical protein